MATSTIDLEKQELAFTPVSKISTIVADLRGAFAEDIMRPVSYRKQQLQALLEGVRQHSDLLAQALYLDLHRCKEEALLYDIQAVEFEIGQALANIDTWVRPEHNRLASDQTGFLTSSMEVRKEPLGCVVIISPWNFPVRLTLLPLIGALAAGNTVVVKPVGGGAYVLRTSLDARVLQTTELLKQKFDHFFYTGNGAVGKIVAKAAAEQLAGVTLELGGKSPAIVHNDVADLGPTAMRLVWAKLMNAGQACVGLDYLLVQRSIKDKLVELLTEVVHKAYTRTPQKSAEYGRIINQRHWQRLTDALAASSGTVVPIVDDVADKADRYIPPTLVDNVTASDSLMRDELFGPILPIITYDTLDEALQIVNSRDQPLALYVFASDKTSEYVLQHTRSGGAIANDAMFHLAAHNFPFGGVGPSGVGNYMGRYSFETFSHKRSVMKRPLWFPPA
ncbi:aldehyde dehydrogenase [Linderina pennispora]|uniref:Aldehyde dehydrogenase n=1 Tax=Linderina pennispora TaxID=61395 RepID=A0A1Y1VZW9_9FUNG|nr:aldehyde dehydrogenase [Linderina pennispora]ORX66792.1 aldehyde dehydrogenase [Linderina pennispora]